MSHQQSDKPNASNFIVICPQCNVPIVIEQLNCGIFRHATYIDTNQQIPPHSSKEVCDELIAEKKIYGCGKPFQISSLSGDNDQVEWIVQKCEYI